MQQLESFSVQESTAREYYILGKKIGWRKMQKIPQGNEMKRKSLS
jgi:hypothetical protein